MSVWNNSRDFTLKYFNSDVVVQLLCITVAAAVISVIDSDVAVAETLV